MLWRGFPSLRKSGFEQVSFSVTPRLSAVEGKLERPNRFNGFPGSRRAKERECR
jgi:hypothetical protein